MRCLFVPDLSIGVSDSQQPFVKVQTEIPDVVYMKEGEPLVFPCRVTNPDAKVSLVKVSVSTVSHKTHQLSLSPGTNNLFLSTEHNM